MDLDEDSIQGIEEKIQSNRSKLEKLVDLYMEGLIDKEIYFHKKEEIENFVRTKYLTKFPDLEDKFSIHLILLNQFHIYI